VLSVTHKDGQPADRSYRRLIGIFGLVIGILTVIAVGSVTAVPTITFDEADEHDGEISLVLTEPDGADVIAYDIDISTAEDDVRINVSETDQFDVESYQCPCGHVTVIGNEHGGESTTATSHPEDQIRLATIHLASETEGEITLEVDSVYSLADSSGEEITHEYSSATFEVEDGGGSGGGENGSDDGGGSGSGSDGGGGGGGGGDGPPELQSTWETGSSTTDAETGEEIDLLLALRNAGESAAVETVTLTTNGETIAETNIRLLSGSQTHLEFAHTFTEPGEYELVAESTHLGTEPIETVTVTGDPVESDDRTDGGAGEEAETEAEAESEPEAELELPGPAETDGSTMLQFGLASVLLILLAGVLYRQRMGNDLPVTDSKTTAAGNTGANEGGLAAFRTTLTDDGIEVRRFYELGDIVHLTYATEHTTKREIEAEIETIADGYIDALEYGLGASTLEATVTDGTKPLASWNVRATWGYQYRHGERSQEAFRATVVDTLEVIDGYGLSTLRMSLADAGIDVRTVSAENNGVSLEYVTTHSTDAALEAEIEAIAAAYVRATARGLNIEPLTATISDGTNELASWSIADVWISKLEDGELSPTVLCKKIVNTISVVGGAS